MPAEQPESIGRYRVEAVLGRGAMGVVYKAHDPVIDRAVAIKLVLADLLDGDGREDYAARFQREAQAAGRCVHPNIVAVFDFATHEGNPYIAMEWVDGMALSQAMRGPAPMPVAEAVGIAAQVLDGLDAAHRLGIVHRDIKPANILLSRRGQVKVADFGISRLDASAMTGTGSVIGTPGYMSPEQCHGDQVDNRSDLFSVGAVLYELVTGGRPFPGRNAHEVWHKLLHEQPSDPAASRPDAPAALHAALRRALAKPPDARFPSAAAMAAALRGALTGALPGAPGGARPGDDDRTVLAAPMRAQPAGIIPDMGGLALDSIVMGTLERELAQHVGPIAGRLVRNAASRADSIEGVCALLSSSLDAASRRRFNDGVQAGLKATMAQDGPSSGSLSSGSLSSGASSSGAPHPGTALPHTFLPGHAALSAAALEQARSDLAHYVGPIARVLVKRAADGCATTGELRDRLAAHLEKAADREAFLRRQPAAPKA